MPYDLLRETPFGQILHSLSAGRCFQYPEQDSTFTYPPPAVVQRPSEPDVDEVTIVERPDPNGAVKEEEDTPSLVECEPFVSLRKADLSFCRFELTPFAMSLCFRKGTAQRTPLTLAGGPRRRRYLSLAS